MRLEAEDLESLRPLLREFAKELVAEMLAEQRPVGSNDRLAYSEAEAAAKLGVEPHVLREQRRLGRIDFTRGPGRRVFYRPEHLEAYLNRPK